jgi:hypothetical protein
VARPTVTRNELIHDAHATAHKSVLCSLAKQCQLFAVDRMAGH